MANDNHGPAARRTGALPPDACPISEPLPFGRGQSSDSQKRHARWKMRSALR